MTAEAARAFHQSEGHTGIWADCEACGPIFAAPDLGGRTALDEVWKELIAEALRRNAVVAVGKHRRIIEAAIRAEVGDDMTTAYMVGEQKGYDRGRAEGLDERQAAYDEGWTAAEAKYARAEGLDVERLARAWLNAMTKGDHNERCLEQREMDCPVGAEVREFTPRVAAEYARLGAER